ncbi:hypothetical protein ACPCSP_29380 [Streptomyces cinereoruber]|uniref:hypothetical protein n=1 Tax=Streptomyces cinereoruber TaxID=67260 RepID=UPI003C2AAD4D
MVVALWAAAGPGSGGAADGIDPQPVLVGLRGPVGVVAVLQACHVQRGPDRQIGDDVLDRGGGLGERGDDLCDGQQRREADCHRRERQRDAHRHAQVGQFAHHGDLSGDDDVRDPVERAGDRPGGLRQILVLALHLRPVLVQGR